MQNAEKEKMEAHTVFLKANRYLLIRKYFVYVAIGIIVLMINWGYPLYEKAAMHIVRDTGWVTSSNGKFQARALSKRFLSHRLTKLKIRAKVDTTEWFALMDEKIFEQFSFDFTTVKDPVKVKWNKSGELYVQYHATHNWFPAFVLTNRLSYSLSLY